MYKNIFIFSFFLIFWSGSLSIAQNDDCEVQHSVHYYDSLNAEYGQNKVFDTKYLKPSLLALKAYPELKGSSVTFIEKPIHTLMAARPTPGFIFRSKSKRHYYIIISTNSKNNSEELLDRMSRCGLTGIIAHEYAHLIDYSHKSNLGMIWLGIRYYFDKKEIESNTDLEAIRRGFSDELIEFDRYIFNSKFASKRYLRNKKKHYLSVNEIKAYSNHNL